MFRIEVNITKGKANFQLHAVVGRDGAVPNSKITRDPQSPKLAIPKIKKFNIHSEFCPFVKTRI